MNQARKLVIISNEKISKSGIYSKYILNKGQVIQSLVRRPDFREQARGRGGGSIGWIYPDARETLRSPVLWSAW